MANGAVYAVVPFVNKQAPSAVAGIVGALLAGFLFKRDSPPWPMPY
jgi:NNP family nitrate/nitrite transporter-like MFS transporter